VLDSTSFPGEIGFRGVLHAAHQSGHVFHILAGLSVSDHSIDVAALDSASHSLVRMTMAGDLAVVLQNGNSAACLQ
jgi:hypothetical protein